VLSCRIRKTGLKPRRQRRGSSMSDHFGTRPAELRGERVKLVPLDKRHLEALRRWRSDPEVTRYRVTQAAPTPEEMRVWLDHNRAAGVLMWLIKDEHGRPNGYIDLFDLDGVNRKAELSLMIGERDVWGKGYAFQSVATLGLGQHKVYLSVFAENAAARRAYAACGFREDGVLRDDVCRDGSWHDQILMSVLEHEFTALDATR
jgi:RimJ/RimL family protein N-acetyltransferase